MRVVLAHAFGREAGGAETHVEWLRDLLEARGDRPFVVDLNATSAAGRSTRELTAACESHAPDVVHLHNPGRRGLAVVERLARRGHVVVQTLHDHQIVCPAGSLFRKGEPCERCVGTMFLPSGIFGCVSLREALERSVFAARERVSPSRAISRYLTPSEALAQKVRGAGVRTPIDVVGSFLPADRFVRTPQAPADRTIVFAGRLVLGKGLDTLLTASRGLRARVVVIGTGPLFPALAARIQSEGLSHVELASRLSGAAYLERLRQASVVVVPSEAAEGLPMVACEAFSSGIPVVATGIGGLTELVGGENARGLIVPPRDPDALRGALSSMLDLDERRQAMGHAALAYARETLSGDRFYQTLHGIYRAAGRGVAADVHA